MGYSQVDKRFPRRDYLVLPVVSQEADSHHRADQVLMADL